MTAIRIPFNKPSFVRVGDRYIADPLAGDRWSDDGAFTKRSHVLLEGFVHGWQHTWKGFFCDNRGAFSLIRDRAAARQPQTATAGHFVPAPLPQSAQ